MEIEDDTEAIEDDTEEVELKEKKNGKSLTEYFNDLIETRTKRSSAVSYSKTFFAFLEKKGFKFPSDLQNLDFETQLKNSEFLYTLPIKRAMLWFTRFFLEYLWDIPECAEQKKTISQLIRTCSQIMTSCTTEIRKIYRERLKITDGIDTKDEEKKRKRREKREEKKKQKMKREEFDRMEADKNVISLNPGLITHEPLRVKKARLSNEVEGEDFVWRIYHGKKIKYRYKAKKPISGGYKSWIDLFRECNFDLDCAIQYERKMILGDFKLNRWYDLKEEDYSFMSNSERLKLKIKIKKHFF
jgi:hypothetical protein